MGRRLWTRRSVLAALPPTLLALRRPALLAEAVVQAAGPAPGSLADALLRCSRDEALPIAARALAAGADLTSLLGAIFSAGIRDIRPRHVGGKLHAVLVVESIFQLAEAAGPEGGRLLALWNADDLKRSQQQDREEGDWSLGPRPSASAATEGEARREFLASMEAWDDDRADRAVTALLPHHDLDSVFEILWPLAARSYVNIGHKIIFASQTHRTLKRVGPEQVEPALRSLVHGLLHRSGGKEMDEYETSRSLAGRFPAGWAGGTEDPGRASRLLGDLRACDPGAAQSRIAEAFKEGTGPATVWDALRLWASEIFLRRARSRPADERPALLPVHAVTVVNAMGHAFRSAGEDRSRRLLVLQAAGWLPRLEGDLARFSDLTPRGRKITDLSTLPPPAGAAPASLADLLADPGPERAIAWLGAGGKAQALRSAAASHLARKGIEHHQHKYAAAILEESRLVHPSFEFALLAAGLPYLAAPSDAETEIARRSASALAAASL